MSSDEYESTEMRYKKRRLQNACDTCRRRKVKCDSSSMPKNICTNCIAYRVECTHQEPIRKRGPKSGYIESLEDKVKRLEGIINKLPPDIKSSIDTYSSSSLDSSTMTVLSPILSNSAMTPSSTTSTDSDESADADDFQHIGLSEHFKQLEISHMHGRFFGPSSGFMLVKNAVQAKDDYAGQRASPVVPLRHNWELHPWEAASAVRSAPRYQFPLPDLMHSLIFLYLEHMNSLFGILHEPTFRRSVAEGLHLQDYFFGAVVLAVCAMGARFSNDPRVFVDGHSELSAGWVWFDQIQTVRKTMFSPPTLYELQLYVIMSIYLNGTSTPQTSYIVISLGLRYCQELGLHRRKPKGYRMTMEDEMKKRCFWLLVSLDRVASSFAGQPSAIREEDYDAELPIDCDDEYMDPTHPDLMFKQPSGKPSLISFIITFHKLVKLLGFCLRTLYSTKKSRLLLGLVGEDWEQRTVSSLDSALNHWVDSVPDHLRWDPYREHAKFFRQSTALYCYYYNVRVQIHRPFIQRSSPQGEASLAMCVNASRACSHILEAAMKRGLTPSPPCVTSAFVCGIILIINVFKTRRAGGHTIPSVARDLADIDTCLRYLQMTGRRWSGAGRLGQLMQDLSSAQNISFPLDSPLVETSRKRSHAEMNPPSPTVLSTMSAPPDFAAESVPFSSDPPLTPHPNQLSLEDLLDMDIRNGGEASDDHDPFGMWSEVSHVFDEHGWESYVANMLGGSGSDTAGVLG